MRQDHKKHNQSAEDLHTDKKRMATSLQHAECTILFLLDHEENKTKDGKTPKAKNKNKNQKNKDSREQPQPQL